MAYANQQQEKEYQKQYREKNKDKAKEYQKKYRTDDYEVYQAYRKAYYRANRDREIKRRLVYYYNKKALCKNI